MIGIYIIYNTFNEKMYVGSSANVQQRILIHLKELSRNNHHSIILQREFNKYGLETFKFYLVKEIKQRSKKQLIYWEQYFIDYYSPEYNICPEAYSCLGRISSQSHKDKIANALKGRKLSEERKQQIRESWKIRRTKKVSKETRDKLSSVWKGRKQTEEHILHRVASRKKSGVAWHSEETKKKIEGNKSNTGKIFTKEHRKKISETRKRRIQEGLLIKGMNGRYHRR